MDCCYRDVVWCVSSARLESSPLSNARTSDSRNRRWPPGVRMLPMRPAAAQRVTVFGSTRNNEATSPGVSSLSPVSTTPPLFLAPRHPLQHGRPLPSPKWPERHPMGCCGGAHLSYCVYAYCHYPWLTRADVGISAPRPWFPGLCPADLSVAYRRG